MHLALNTLTIGSPPAGTTGLETQLDAARGAGFDLIGLDSRSLAAEPSIPVRQLRTMLGDRGLKCLELHVLRIDGSEGMEEAFRFFGGAAAELGASWVGATVDLAPDNAAETVSRCGEILAEYGVALAVEFIPRFRIGTLKSGIDLVRTVDRSDVKLIVDTYHFFTGSPWDSLSLLRAADIAHIQFNDGFMDTKASKRGSGLPPRELPGHGDFNLPAFCEAISEMGFDGVVELEFCTPDLLAQDPLLAAASARELSIPYWPSAGSRPCLAPDQG